MLSLRGEMSEQPKDRSAGRAVWLVRRRVLLESLRRPRPGATICRRAAPASGAVVGFPVALRAATDCDNVPDETGRGVT